MFNKRLQLTADQRGAFVARLNKWIEGKPVALVLAGGGSKGAYQTGVWRALKHIGCPSFHAIAGTSVGALNALLIAKGNMSEALRLWRETSFLRLSPHGFWKFFLATVLLWGPGVSAMILGLLA